MPFLQYREGTVVEHRSAHGFVIHHAQSVTGIDRLNLRDHALFVVGSPVTTVDRWEDSAPIKREWSVGAVGFLPANSELRSRVGQPYHETIFRIPARMLADSARGLVELSEVDLRFENISDATTQPLAQALMNVATTIDGYQGAALLMESVALSVTIAVLRKMTPHLSKPPDKATGLNICKKRRVVDFVEANLHRQMSLAELASVAAMSRFHFSRSFRETMGLTPLNYVLQRRVEMAKKHLIDVAKPLAAVALDCGFASQSHFTSSFRVATGATPAKWRMQRVALPEGRRAQRS